MLYSFNIRLLLTTSIMLVLISCSSPESSSKLLTKDKENYGVLYSFSLNNKIGFKDKNGSIIIKPIYNSVLSDTFSNKINFVLDTSFWAINKQGKKILRPFIYDNGPDYISEGLFRYIQNDKIGYANKDGDIKIKPYFDGAFPFNNNRAVVCTGCKEIKSGGHHYWKGGKWGYLNKAGTLAIRLVKF